MVRTKRQETGIGEGSSFFFSSRGRHTRLRRDWSSDVCSSDLYAELRDPVTLAEASDRLVGPCLLALAVHFAPDPDGRGSEVRLIDNRVLHPPRKLEETS